MNKHTDGDPLAELAALRQRLGDLEAEHRELKRQATRTRRPSFFTKFLLSALPVALLLAAVGALYAVDALSINGTGNVGIGTTSPAAKLDVAGTVRLGAGTASSWFPYTDNNAYITGVETIIRSPSAEFVRIDSNGNVGIGTTEPDTTLDVNGTLNVTGNSTLKGDLTVTGNAITIPGGTTDQRQTEPKNGALRYNTTVKMVEVYVEGMWCVIETTPYMGDKLKKVTVFHYAGKDQQFLVPAGVTKIFVKTWGAGGAGGTKGGYDWNYGSYGGGGGFSRGILTVTPGKSLTVIVGGPGRGHQEAVGYGGGGGATPSTPHVNQYCGGGGGRSAILDGGSELIVAGGGGGGGSTRSADLGGRGNSGGAGGGLLGENGYSQYDGKFRFGGRGGGQDVEGGGGETNGGPGKGNVGGTPTIYGAGGGGGWKGGGSGAYSETNTMGGGGGGSGQINAAVLFGMTTTGTQRQPPMQTDRDYEPGVGSGGDGGGSNTLGPLPPGKGDGGNGLVVIRW